MLALSGLRLRYCARRATAGAGATWVTLLDLYRVYNFALMAVWFFLAPMAAFTFYFDDLFWHALSWLSPLQPTARGRSVPRGVGCSVLSVWQALIGRRMALHETR